MEIVVLSCTVQFKDYKQASSFNTSGVSKSEHSSRSCAPMSSLDLRLLASLVPDTLAYAASPLPLHHRLPSAHRLACHLCTICTVCVPTACWLCAVCVPSVCLHLFTCAVRPPDLATACAALCAAISSTPCAIAPALCATALSRPLAPIFLALALRTLAPAPSAPAGLLSAAALHPCCCRHLRPCCCHLCPCCRHLRPCRRHVRPCRRHLRPCFRHLHPCHCPLRPCALATALPLPFPLSPTLSACCHLAPYCRCHLLCPRTPPSTPTAPLF